MKKCVPLILLLCLTQSGCQQSDERRVLATEIEKSLQTETLEKWYPLARDSAYGGFISEFSYEFKPTANQDKMIVTQARHTWTNAMAAMRYPGQPQYAHLAKHGADFLSQFMWDKKYGGFYTLVDRTGAVKDSTKTAYGNSFGIYALATYYQLSKDSTALKLAKDAFHWLEDHSHDAEAKGYYQHLHRDGSLIRRDTTTPSTSETGYKDQNSSIHLLEAFTELYAVWPDELVRERLEEMLALIRDRITTEKGYLTLFFLPDWTPVSLRDSSESVLDSHHHLDHVSFGHDIETAYLLLEASAALHRVNDSLTHSIAKRMVDHALKNGWDATGGFYDEGYYFKGDTKIRITRDTKNWWAQAEGLNSLLLMADLYPDDEMKYFEKFKMQWRYIDKNLIDHEFGDWFAGGIDKQPKMKKELKGHIWKAAYHQYRSMANCVKRLDPETAKTQH